MNTFLTWYLLVTGALAALALAAPWLVVMGMFALIVPGLALALAPTAFLWGAIFASAWWPVQAVAGDAPAALVAAAATAWAVRWIPVRFNRALDARVAALRAGDVLPDAPVALRGTVALERADVAFEDPTDHTDVRRWRRLGRGLVTADVHDAEPGPYPLACDALCAALLFTPGVDAVVLRPVPEPGSGPPAAPAELVTPESDPAGDEDAPWAPTLPEPALFRIDRTGACRASVQPRRPSGAGWPQGADALHDAWRLRISQGECITREPAGEGNVAPALTVAILRWTDPPDLTPRGDSFSLAAPVLSVRRLEIRGHDGAVLLCQTAVDPDRGRLARVLSVATFGGPANIRFTWAWERGPNTHGPTAQRTVGGFGLVDLLAKWTTLRIQSDPPQLALDARDQLRALLSDPTREADDPGFALSARVLQEMAEHGPVPDDAAFVAALIADRRVRRFDRLGKVIERLGADAHALRPVIAARIRAAAVNDFGDPGPGGLARYLPDRARYPRDDPAVATLGTAFRAMPPGAFAELHPEESALLDDPPRRAWVPDLVARMTDAGPRMAAWFGNVIRDGYREYHRGRGLFMKVSPDVDAARDALARLGPPAASALAPLELMIADGLITNPHDPAWQLALLRLGKPVESFGPDERVRPQYRKTPAQLHQALREQLTRYERELAKERPRAG